MTTRRRNSEEFSATASVYHVGFPLRILTIHLYYPNKFIHISADELWVPDFALYDNADGDFIVSELVRAKVRI